MPKWQEKTAIAAIREPKKTRATIFEPMQMQIAHH